MTTVATHPGGFHADDVVRGVNDLVDGLDGLSSQLD